MKDKEIKLVWSRLKMARCPQCNKEMKDAFVRTNPYYCECGFKITQEKFEKIINDMYKPKQRSTEYQTADERLSELNNYGRERVSEDFSDSRFADRRPILEEE